MFKKFLLLFFLILLTAGMGIFYFIHKGQISHDPQDVIYRSDTIQISVPSCPLKKGSLSVESTFSEKSLAAWNKRQHAESYNLLENAAIIWKEQENIEDFLVIGTMPPRMHSDRFFWEIIPFSHSRYNFIDQFSVVWNHIFNSLCFSRNERQAIKSKYSDYIPFFSNAYNPPSEQSSCTANDPFCHPDVIAKQVLYEGDKMIVLYNYAPIGEDKLHFLILPKAHRTGFPELTLDEYLEAQEIASKLILYFAKKGFPIVFLLHKTGKYAGQTVPHWHEHLIFASDETNEFLGKLAVILKMIFPAKPLPDDELEVLVKKYRQQVQEAIK